MVGVCVGGGWSLPMGTCCPWVGCHCPLLGHGCGGQGVIVHGGCSCCLCVLVICGDIEKVVINVAHQMSEPCQWFYGGCHCHPLLFVGDGCSSLRKWSLMWHTCMGEPHQWFGAWWRHHASSYLGVCGQKVTVDVAHLAGCATSVAWW